LPTSAKLALTIVLAALAFLVWRFLGGKTPPETNEPISNRFAFREVGEDWGLAFRHDPGHPTFYYPEILGSGLAVADFDNDGRLDILCRGSSPGKGHPHAKPGPTTRLYLRNGDGRLHDATENSGLADEGYAMGVAVGDVNNDGRVDLYFCNFGKDRLYLGNGDGAFVDVTQAAGISSSGFASSACFVDFDRDGLLDLYVANYTKYDKYVECTLLDGRIDYCQPRIFKGLPHKLYRNVSKQGEVRFIDVSAKAGIAHRAARGLGVMMCDVNDDHWPDIYVANDVEPNFLWINQRDGTFLESAALEGVAVCGGGQAQASMGLAEADLDGDGKLDLAVTNVRDEYTTIYCRQAHGFRDRSAALGVMRLTRPFTGFGLTIFDVDCDGSEEIIQVNGRVTQLDNEPAAAPPTDPYARDEVRRFWNAYAERSQLMYLNEGRFEDAKNETGDFGDWVGIGRGLAMGDIDGDGPPDLVAIDLSDRAKLFLNRAERRGHWISVRAVDPSKGGRDSLGALVTAVCGDKRLSKRIRTCGSYQSASEPRAFFGLGPRSQVDRIEIVWPDGDTTPDVFPTPRIDAVHTFKRSRGATER
jgi:enediyne biosynthesis protein E4